ncbi:MAG: S46 family peptidase [Fluviicola sp.]|nr:S46 family peptidase [Fluviicola sp.]MBP6271035.1 S46 family peptidase [Fluviicola sp.]
MKKLVIALVVMTYSLGNIARADEGMWLPFLIGRNYEDMKKHGLRLTQDQIYSINKSSLKDAVISFGGFCTGEIISDQSLILTNHHCGYDAIADASTPEKNYLDNGFWAKNNSEEIAVPGLTATFMVRMEDVSATILKELSASMTAEQRAAKIKEISDILIKDATNGTKYEAFVRDFYDGNEFYLFVKETYTDVRLVGTPPQSAGKFGGDTDNWVWPRHTADFSMFRIYAGKDNKPAAFSAENVPLKPRHSLPVSIKGVKEGDYAMVMGFPGRTNRYLTSYGVEQAISLEQPKIVDVRAKKLEIMKKYMDKDVAVRLHYSSKYAQVANYWKYFIGQTKQLKANNVADKKRKVEAEFTKFTTGKAEYDNVLTDIENAFKTTNSIINIRVYQSEFVRQVDINSLVYSFKLAMDQEAKGNKERAEAMRKAAVEQANTLFSERSMDIELEILEEVLKMYIQDVAVDQQVGLTRSIGVNGVPAFIARVRSNSVFASKEKFEAFMANYSSATLKQDPLFILVKDLDDAYMKATGDATVKQAMEKLARGNRLFVKAVREMQPNKKFYPNANSTMRLTYGNVLSYEPRDAVKYDYYTTIDGVMSKEDVTNPEFNIDPRMKEVWMKKDFGQYGTADGKLVVNFLTNNDITGGNSGSPCINANGELIGTAFDGNWEAMSGDIYFEPTIQRTIVCDIRYVLWIIDKCYGASNLVKEMKLVK